MSRWSGPTAGEKKQRLPELSLKRNTEGQKAEAGVFFRKEIFAAATVWESLLSPAVRPSQEAPPPTALSGQRQTLLRTGRGEVRWASKQLWNFGGGPTKGVLAILSAGGDF